MKRARTYKETGEGVSSIETQYSGSSFSDLPREILLNILLRLSIRRILVSKCVCKTWYDLVCDHEFAKLHFDQAEVYPLVQGLQSKRFYFVLPDKDDFEVKLGMCDHTHSKSGCICNVQLKLDSQFRVLERKINLRKKDLRWKYSVAKDKRYKYSVANSCNGYLCLFDPSNGCPPFVCNPITGEFINLPDSEKFDFKYCYNTCYGFGFSPANNQYKVIRMSGRGISLSNNAEVHILGTNTWKNIGFFTQPMPKLSPTYLKGFLYWSSETQLSCVFSFDIEKEQFGSVLAPRVDQGYRHGSVCVGVLGGELCVSRVCKSGAIHIWVMKDHEGTIKEWSKVFSFNMYSYRTWHSGPFQPIKYLNDGALLMYHSYTNLVNMDPDDASLMVPKDALLYMDPKRNRFRFLKIHGMDSTRELIAHTPSFVSLKHAVSRQNVKVLNVMSRCNELKLHEKTEEIAIVEEEFYPDTNLGSDLDYSSDSENDIDYYL